MRPLGSTNRHLGGGVGLWPLGVLQQQPCQARILARYYGSCGWGAFGWASHARVNVIEHLKSLQTVIRSAVSAARGTASCPQGIWIDRTAGFCFAWNENSGQTMAQTRPASAARRPHPEPASTPPRPPRPPDPPGRPARIRIALFARGRTGNFQLLTLILLSASQFTLDLDFTQLNTGSSGYCPFPPGG